ncbi:MFS transporter [Paenarthrobacter nicotinovorans]|uniref:MFS transporter n=1 Tax=Paenarthrobacter nicotinovorans TaxID=29320 RepID=A0ABV0GXL2_PAENI|nr:MULTISPECIES: MFS transporter [Micrococcaceae]BCW58674.1 MFS transporter [Arthrobacter sp. StoSoilB20]
MTSIESTLALSEVERHREARRVVQSSFLGSVLEFYDFLLYGVAAALVFGPVFFSNLPSSVATIASLGTFAAGYLARPIGGIIFGHFGDRLGRKSMLLWSLSIMGVASFLVGLVPPESVIGPWGAVSLVLLRLMQGVALGGEWGGATLMALEHADPGKRGFMAAFVNAGAPAGGIIGTLVMGLFSAILNEADFLSWGWRVPFLLSALMLALGLYIRLKVSESPLFVAAAHQKKGKESTAAPIVAIMKSPRTVLVVALACIASFALQSSITTFGLSYAVDQGSAREDVLFGFTIGQIAAIVLILAYAKLSDRVGRRPVMIFGCIASIVLIYPMFELLKAGGIMFTALAFVVFCIGQNAIYGPMGAFISEQFATQSRYTGASVGYQLASLVGAGFTPTVVAAVYAASEKSIMPVLILIAAISAISAVFLWISQETRSRDLTK